MLVIILGARSTMMNKKNIPASREVTSGKRDTE
jgi:hypothetical protein